MPSLDERREVAARLRRIAKGGAPEWATTACCIAELLGEDDYPLWSGSEKLFDLLADLIEPEPERTCSIVDKYEGYASSHLRLLGRCSVCGNVIETEHNFCFRCGAKVVEE